MNENDLYQWFVAGEKPKEKWLIGTEHEKLLVNLADNRRPAYEGENGVGALLDALRLELGGEAMMEGGNIIGVKTPDGGSLTLEPGGQFELSGAPLENLHQTCREAGSHLKTMRRVCDKMGLGMLGVGHDPLWRREDISWMPKGRYKIMREHMPKVGSLGLDMMLRTSTIQVNLDYQSEADMAKKFKTSLALQPVATAIFANSPFVESKPSGFLTRRAHIWSDTDPARCGVPECVFDDNFGYQQWVDYILDVPMYFIYRGGTYHNVAGLSFRDFMDGTLQGFEGQRPTIDDWENHVSTAFPEVRLKQYLEMRGADGGAWNMICALPALWVGALYDDEACEQAAELAKNLTANDVAEAQRQVARDGLKASIGGRPMQQVATELIAIASRGLTKRGRLDGSGNDESGFLAGIKHIAASGETNAEALLKLYHGKWGGDVSQIYKDYLF